MEVSSSSSPIFASSCSSFRDFARPRFGLALVFTLFVQTLITEAEAFLQFPAPTPIEYRNTLSFRTSTPWNRRDWNHIYGGGPRSTTTTSISSRSKNDYQDRPKRRISSRPPKIECKRTGLFAYPGDCSRFVRCVDFRGTGRRFSVFHFDCPPGMYVSWTDIYRQFS